MDKEKREIIDNILSFYSPQQTIKLLKELISIPSHNQVVWQEDRLVSYLADYLYHHGIDKLSIDYVEENRPNLIAELPGRGKGKSLLLNGHTDTAVPSKIMEHPYKPVIRDNHIYGLGAADMKGSLTAMLTSLVLLKESNLSLKGDLFFAGVIDQKQCSKGTVRLVEDRFKTDYAVVGEPTDLKICHAHRGREWIKIIIQVVSQPEQEDRNAIYQASRIASEIESLNKDLKHRYSSLTISVGVISGGDAPDNNPDLASLELDGRYIQREEGELIYQELRKILARQQTLHPYFKMEILPMVDRVCSLKNPPLSTARDSKLISAFERALGAYGTGHSEVTCFNGWSDAALLSEELGTEAVLFGPGLPEKYQAGKEALRVDDLLASVRVYLALIIDLCV